MNFQIGVQEHFFICWVCFFLKLPLVYFNCPEARALVILSRAQMQWLQLNSKYFDSDSKTVEKKLSPRELEKQTFWLHVSTLNG